MIGWQFETLLGEESHVFFFSPLAIEPDRFSETGGVTTTYLSAVDPNRTRSHGPLGPVVTLSRRACSNANHTPPAHYWLLKFLVYEKRSIQYRLSGFSSKQCGRFMGPRYVFGSRYLTGS